MVIPNTNSNAQRFEDGAVFCEGAHHHLGKGQVSYTSPQAPLGGEDYWEHVYSTPMAAHVKTRAGRNWKCSPVVLPDREPDRARSSLCPIGNISVSHARDLWPGTAALTAVKHPVAPGHSSPAANHRTNRREPEKAVTVPVPDAVSL